MIFPNNRYILVQSHTLAIKGLTLRLSVRLLSRSLSTPNAAQLPCRLHN